MSRRHWSGLAEAASKPIGLEPIGQKYLCRLSAVFKVDRTFAYAYGFGIGGRIVRPTPHIERWMLHGFVMDNLRACLTVFAAPSRATGIVRFGLSCLRNHQS
jgi:hypothetical protein